MARCVGTVSRGIRTPIISDGDDLPAIVADSVLSAACEEEFELKDRDIIAVTEAVVARAQGNNANTDQIAKDIKDKFGKDCHLGIVFPILSRNRFAVCLRGMARAVKKVTLLLSYPADEVGNHLISLDQVEEKDVNPWLDVLSLDRYRELFGVNHHPFTGIDYVDYYISIIEDEGAEADIVFANDPRVILDYTDHVLYCDVHTRKRTYRKLSENGAKVIYGMCDILSSPVDGSGYNEQYGLLGSNKSTEDKVKLFPRDTQQFVEDVQKIIKKRIDKDVEVMVYGDGAFKDPVGKIWELADPVVSPGYTAGLEGTPNEVKLKYLADNEFPDHRGDALGEAIAEFIKKKDDDLKGSMASQGTTPRRITDLVGSLSDLTSGSGDKGTPVVLIQGYFDSYAD